MPTPRTYNTQGIVIKDMELGDADRIVTVYTPDRGKLRAVAKGARRIKSRKGGQLQPLTEVRISIVIGRTLDSITEVETVNSNRGLREDLGLLSQAIYVAELVDGFTADGAVNPREYELLSNILVALQVVEDTEQLMRYCEVQLLAMAGFGPEFGQCVECGIDLGPRDHLLSCVAGGLVGPECKASTGDPLIHLSMNSIKVLRFFQDVGLDQAQNLPLTGEIKSELQRVLAAYLSYILDREPRSAGFITQVAAMGKTDSGGPLGSTST